MAFVEKEARIVKALLTFALPIFFSNLFQQFYNTMDTMIVGHFLGEKSLAAIGASAAIYELLEGFALGVGNGLSIVCARAYGSQNQKLLKRSVAASLLIGAGLTIIIMLLATFLMKPLLLLLNTPNNIVNEAYLYIMIISLFVGVMFAYNLCAELLRAIGNSFIPLVFLIVSSLLNVGLDILFIAWFKMGIEGAAIATVIAEGISCLLCLIYIYHKTKILVSQKKHFKYDGALFKELMGQGFSMGLMMSIVSTGTVILQSAINNFGYLIIAGHTTVRKLSSFCTMPTSSLTMALATFVS